MRHTIKEISETLFRWLASLQLDNETDAPPTVSDWSEKDWQVARSILFIHGMGPMWGALCVKGWNCEAMPQDFREYLISQYHENGLRIKKIYQLYDEIGEGLNANGIEYIPFKGVQLATEIYTDPAVRPMADIDLYVGECDLTRLTKALEACGFVMSVGDSCGATYMQSQWFENNQGILTLMENAEINSELYCGENRNSPICVDVHYQMNLREIYSISKYFESARLSQEKRLPVDFYFFYLLLHAAKHLLGGSGRWLSLIELYQYQLKHTLDIELIVQLAKKERISHLLVVPLIISRQLGLVEFRELEARLRRQVSLRHKILLNNLRLSELSCCSPWQVSLLRVFLWAKDIKNITDWIGKAKKRQREISLRQGDRIQNIPPFTSRMYQRCKKMLLKEPRATWNIFKSLGLNPHKDWK